MPFFQKHTSDPADMWPSQKRVALALDLPRVTLNAIMFDAPSDLLREIFGKPSNRWPFHAEKFVYAENALVVETVENRIAYFAVAIARDEAEGIGPGQLDIVAPEGAPFSIDGGTPIEAVITRLGEPVEIDREEDETVFYYSINGCRMEFECAPDGHIRRVNWFPE